MKWKLLCVLIINLLTICVIGCWPFIPPPPPPPMQLYEDHYVRISHGPYDEHLAHMASHPTRQTSLNGPMPHIFYPMEPMPPPMVYAEPQERMIDESLNLGNSQEFVGYSSRDPMKPMMKVRHTNYRYRKRMKTQRPIPHNAFTHKKEVKYQEYRHQPRRYNVIDNRREYENKQNIANSVNEKLPQNSKKDVLEVESNRQNLSSNITENSRIKSDKSSKDLNENSSQTTAKPNPIAQNMEMPIEITSYAMKSPNGAVTTVTEMLYDVENNPFKPPTTTPFITPFLPLSTPTILPIVEEPRVTQTPYLNNAYSETETDPSLTIQPINTAVTAKFNSITMSPMTPVLSNSMSPMISWTNQRETNSPTTDTWTPASPTPTPPHLRPSPFPMDYSTRRSRKRFTTSTRRPPLAPTIKSSARESQAGLSGAAIAGIIIGSLVSIMLLAGTSLFVMYRNPFRRTLGLPRSSGSQSQPTVGPNDPNSIPRVNRWQPRRLRRP